MCNFATLIRTGVMAAALLATPLFSQTTPSSTMDPNYRSDTTSSSRNDNGFNFGWLGLIGLAGLAGMKSKSTNQAGFRTDDDRATQNR